MIKILYYYTSVETMKYILSGSNIFATNLLYMNDAEEYSNGLKELKTIINEKHKKELISEQQVVAEINKGTTSYSISFSTEKDLLSQWSMYAGESGVSIAMEFTGDEIYKGYDEKGDRKNVAHYSIKPRQVYYCTKSAMKKEKYNEVKKAIWDAIYKNNTKVTLADFEGNAQYIWKEMTPYVKRYEFSAEDEYRLVFDWAHLIEEFRIDYRNDQNVLKPYLDIECAGGWPIHEIIVGPGFNQEVVFRSLVHFLNNSDIKVPILTGTQFQKRCKKYFSTCGCMPDEIKEIWKNKSSDLRVRDEQVRWNLFINMREEMLKVIKDNDEFGINLKKRELTKKGIILSRSGIPYIF